MALAVPVYGPVCVFYLLTHTHFLYYVGPVIVEQVILFGDYVKLTPSPSNPR